MKSSSASDYKPDDKCVTAKGEVVTVKEVVGRRYIKIVERLEKQVYIPAHGEIEKLGIDNH